MFASMYVDVQISFSHDNMNELSVVRLQLVVDDIGLWTLMNGFTFSPSKTLTMQFYKHREHVILPDLRLNNQVILYANETV